MNSPIIIVTFLATLIFSILSTYFIVTANLDKVITDKINDSDFKKEIAKSIKIPILIFDESKTYVYDGGASKFISKIEVVKKDGIIDKIVLTMNNKTNFAPIITSLNSDIIFQQATPSKESEWEYNALVWSTPWAGGGYNKTPPAKLFKLEIF